jgi:hypothetical protein
MFDEEPQVDEKSGQVDPEGMRGIQEEQRS